MKRARREFLKGGSLALIGGGFLSRVDKVAAMQPGVRPASLTETVKSLASGPCAKLLLGPMAGEAGPPAPAAEDRLTLDWNKRTVRRFKEMLAAIGIEAFLVRDPLNTTYLTGYWHTTTERPEATFMNRDDVDPWFLYPALDRDLVKTWWFGGGWEYFDSNMRKALHPTKEGSCREKQWIFSSSCWKASRNTAYRERRSLWTASCIHRKAPSPRKSCPGLSG